MEAGFRPAAGPDPNLPRAADGRGGKFSLALISYSFPPVVGGSEIEAQRVCAALQDRGHQVRVLCGGGDPMPPVKEWLDPRGLRVRLFGGGWSAGARPRVFAAGVAWWLIMRRREYQVVYFLMTGLQVAIGVPVARLLGKRVVMKFSGSGEIRRVREFWLGRLELWLLRRLAHRILVLNPGMRQEADELGFDPARIVWMPNPVDTAEFRPYPADQRPGLRRALGLPPAAPVVIYVGRLSPEKELSSLAGAFARVTREHPEAVLVLVGDGPSRSELTDRVRALGIERQVRFAGMVDSTAVPQWLQASDVFALVSSLEGFPCSLIEAMSAGLPSLVSDIPATVQLVQNETHGLVADLKNEEAIAHGLVRLLADPDLRARLGAAARLRILENYSSDQVASRYEALFGGLPG